MTEPDDRCGVGELRLRVQAVDRSSGMHLDGEPWVPVCGVPLLRYDSNWNTVPEAEFIAAQRAVVARPAWIIDGNSTASMPDRFTATDTISFLDLPPLVRLWGIARRRLRYRGGRYAAGVHDHITGAFLRYVMAFRRRHAPRVRACIAEPGAHAVLVEVTSRRQAKQLIARLGGPVADTARGSGDG